MKVDILVLSEYTIALFRDNTCAKYVDSTRLLYKLAMNISKISKIQISFSKKHTIGILTIFYNQLLSNDLQTFTLRHHLH